MGFVMNEFIIYVLGGAAVLLLLAVLWYLIKTVRIIWTYNSLLAIAAVVFSPIVHIAFYFIPKDGFDKYDKRLFKRYFTSIVALIALGIVSAIAIPNVEPRQTIVDQTDLSQPWDWDIRSESQEETLFQTEVDSSDIAKAESLHYKAIFQVHPDADEIVDSPEFSLWLQGQTAEEYEVTAKILEEGIASEVIYILSNFKKDLATYRSNEYQARRENAQALAQKQYKEKQSRELESIKSRKLRDAEQHRQQEIVEYEAANRTLPPTSQGASEKRSLSYIERQEREKLKALLSKPHKGSNGELTRSQREALMALETGQPMPSNSRRNSSTPKPVAPPSNITSCDNTGCWDNNGTRYNKGAGDTYFPSTGGSCQSVGGQMQCN